MLCLQGFEGIFECILLILTCYPPNGKIFANAPQNACKQHLEPLVLEHFIRRLFVTCGVFARYFFVAFPWLFRGPLLSRKTVFGPFSWFFRGFFVAPVLGKIYASQGQLGKAWRQLRAPPPVFVGPSQWEEAVAKLTPPMLNRRGLYLSEWKMVWSFSFILVPSHRKVIHTTLSQNTLCKRLFIHIRELLAQPNTICMCKRANFNMYRVVFLIRNFCLPPPLEYFNLWFRSNLWPNRASFDNVLGPSHEGVSKA